MRGQTVILDMIKIYSNDMVQTTKITKQDDGVYGIEIPEECMSKLGWRNGYVLKIDVDDNKLVIQKLSGFMGM